MSNMHIRFPWIVSFGCAILFLVVSIVGTPIGSQLEQWAHLPVNSGVLIQQFLLTIFSALTVIAFGGWRKAGFYKTVSWRNFLLVLPLFIAPVVLLFLSGIAATNPVQLMMLVIFTAMIGFAEEALCRGVMLGAFLPRGALRAAIISSLVFGSMHLIQIYYGASIAMGLLYVVYAGLIGFGFAALYIRLGGAIWPLIFAHGLFDFLGKIGHGWGAQAQPTGSVEVLVRLAAAILVAVYGYFLLKGSIFPKTASPHIDEVPVQMSK